MVAEKPGKKSKAWLDVTPELDKATKLSLIHASQKVPVIDVSDAVVFALATQGCGEVLNQKLFL
ncbi:MAG: hypothetical protein KBA75_06620 [Alphaproteobacteria bacterium]|nr:hypothetical protein [Alphaproteobacteria bacterium]